MLLLTEDAVTEMVVLCHVGVRERMFVVLFMFLFMFMCISVFAVLSTRIDEQVKHLVSLESLSLVQGRVTESSVSSTSTCTSTCTSTYTSIYTCNYVHNWFFRGSFILSLLFDSITFNTI